jgi:hypothetical protein
MLLFGSAVAIWIAVPAYSAIRDFLWWRSVAPVPATLRAHSGTAVLETPEGTLYRYAPADLPVAFEYQSTPQLPITVLRNGNRFCLTADQSDRACAYGEALEVFTKPWWQSPEEAIRKATIPKSDRDTCWVERIQPPIAAPRTYAYYRIAYPEPRDPDRVWYSSEEAERCPGRYRRTNQIRYFAYDPHYPDTVLFFDLGQSTLFYVPDRDLWNNTLRLRRWPSVPLGNASDIARPKPPAEEPVTAVREAEGGTVYRYESPELKIAFEFLVADGGSIYVTREISRVCVSPRKDDRGCRAGHKLEVFEKQPDVALADAIKEKTLRDIPEEDCFVTAFPKENAPNGFEYAQISYPPSSDPDSSDFDSPEARRCPDQYRVTDGVRYFVTASNRPDKYAFLDLAEDAIPAGRDGLSWQDTLQFTD